MEEKIFNELKEASEPVIEFLKKYYDPHTTAIITENHVKIVRDDIGIAIKID